MLRSSLYKCRVTHWRSHPVKNSFTYGFFLFALDLTDLDLFSYKLFGQNNYHPFRFVDSDYLTQAEGITLTDRVNSILMENNLGTAQRVLFCGHVRLFGYVFNPVAFFYCYDNQNVLKAVIAEVTNTFKERKTYVVSLKGGVLEKDTPKDFYVSPFIPVDTRFQFQFEQPTDTLRVSIDSSDSQGNILQATLTGRRKSLNDSRLLFYLFRYPLMTFWITIRIHLQAFKLWMRKVPYFSKSESDFQLEYSRGKTVKSI